MAIWRRLVGKTASALVLGLFFIGLLPAQEGAASVDEGVLILPIWNAMMKASTPEKTILTEMDRLIEQCGTAEGRDKIGFSFIYPAGQPEVLRRNCRLAKKRNLCLGLIIGMQTHGNARFGKQFINDLRNYQWNNDGSTWGSLSAPEKGLAAAENLMPLSPSRYCHRVRIAVEREARLQARQILEVMKEFPGVICVVNPLIEQGTGGRQADDGSVVFSDVGPYTTTEFRDWLRHAGQYAVGKRFAGQGAPPPITGPHVTIDGAERSPFFDDPSPAESNGTGKSFNATFGTSYVTWDLCRFDLERFPAPVTDHTTDFLCRDGQRFVPNGFRLPDFRPDSRLWRAWTWVNQDHGGRYPPGNPDKPSFGFAQVMNRNYVNDFCGWMIDEGLSPDLIYAHQVPTEALGKSEKALLQARTLGMGAWTGYVPAARSVGVTRFGRIAPELLTQYATRWGIFEWHPQPNAKPHEQRLYAAAIRDLNEYAAAGCRVLFPGWWHQADEPITHNGVFPLPDSGFTRAIKAFRLGRQAKAMAQGQGVKQIQKEQQLGARGPAESERPNIVMILADDLGWSDTELYKTTTLYKTPNLKRLAARGMLFTRAYAASPLCSPTRASILTGQSTARHGSTAPNHHLPEKRLTPQARPVAAANRRATDILTVTRLDTTLPTLSRLLHDGGYQTAHFGKWHLGPDPYSPLQHGFDVDLPHTAGPGPSGNFVAPWSYPNFQPKFPNEHIEDRMAREAVAWMEKVKEGPFYLQYWQFSVHAPFDAKLTSIQEWRKKVDPEALQRSGTYAAMVESLDDAVGTLLDALDRLAIADNTIVVFSSDNGGNMYNGIREHAGDGVFFVTAPTSNWPLRGGKATIYEGGIRVPQVIAWPGVTQPGSECDAVTQSTDLYPTLLHAAGVTPPAGHVIDGVDLAPALAGKAFSRGPIFTYFPHSPPVPDWLPPSIAVHEGDWKLIRLFHQGQGGGHDYRLYQLADDIGETNDLAAAEPAKVRELDALIQKHLVESQAVVPLPNPEFNPAKEDRSKIGVPAGPLKVGETREQRVARIRAVQKPGGQRKNPSNRQPAVAK